MYIRDSVIPLLSTASLISNNLSLSQSDESHINIAYIHKSEVHVFALFSDNKCLNIDTNNLVTTKDLILQAKWVHISNKDLLVIVSVGSTVKICQCQSGKLLNVFNETLTNSENGFCRGVCALGENLICVGTSWGDIIVYRAPETGHIGRKTTLSEHKVAISTLTSEGSVLVSGDDSGRLIVWKLDFSMKIKKFQDISPHNDFPCTSLDLWKDVLVSSFGNGSLCVFNVESGHLMTSIAAHSRWIHSIQIAKDAGLILSASEDSFVKIWALSENKPFQVQHLYNVCVPDLQIVGAAFTSPKGKRFCVTGYDSNELVFYSCA